MSTYQWLQYHENNWAVARIENDCFYITGISEKFPLNYSHIRRWGPVVYEPIEIPVLNKIRKTSVTKECVVESAEVKEVEKVWPIFDPPYVIENFEYIMPQRNNDCGIVALANVASLTYKDAKQHCFRHGWSSTKGITFGFLEVILEKLGFEWAFRNPNFIVDIPSGVFLIYTKSHVMPLINKGLYNSPPTSQYRISITEIRPKI